MKNSRVLTGVLGALLLLVWGRIGLQITEALGGRGEEIAYDAPAPQAPASIESRFRFPQGARDPFSYGQESNPILPGRNLPKNQAKSWIPPPLRLTGVVVEARGSTAILESGDGLVHFLRRGDTLEGAKVLRISPGVVAYSFQKKKAEWTIDSK